jgi:hypothetical protein
VSDSSPLDPYVSIILPCYNEQDRDFSAAERKELPFLLDRAADAAEALLGEGLAAAQNAFHGAFPGRTPAPADPGPPAHRGLPGGVIAT